MAAIYNGITAEDIEKMLADSDRQFRRENEDEEMCCISSQANGRVFLIFLQDRLETGRFGTITFVAQFEGGGNMAAVNDWNLNMKYTKAYVSPEGKVRLEMDLSAEGVTKQLFLDCLRIYERSLQQL
jgi:hypothetical protein